MTFEPLPHQHELLAELTEMRETGDQNKALILLPSGAGKTHSAAYDVARIKPKSFIYIVHRSEILVQAMNIFKTIWKDLTSENIGVINKDFKDYQKPYLFATIQTLSAKDNYKKLPQDIEYLIVDEFHHIAAPSYVEVVNYFNPRYFIGLTATPERLDGKNIMNFVDNNTVADMDIFEGIKKGVLSEFYYVGLFDNVDYTNIHWNGRDYNKRDLDKYLLIAKRDNAILREYLTRVAPEKRQTLIFCVSVKHVHRMVSLFRNNGIKAAGITYKEPFIERKDIIEKFRQGVYNVLITRDILNEGVDFPECSAVMLLRPTWSKVVFFQQIGRGLRKKEGKKNVLVLDFIGNYHHAFMKREWLGGNTNPESNRGQNRTKPEFKLNLRYNVEFDPRVLDIFDFQRMHAITYRNYQKTELVENYHNVKEKLGGKNPTIKDMDGKYSRVRKRMYLRMFGSWNKFLENEVKVRVNRIPNTKITLDTMKEKYYSLKEELGQKTYLNRFQFMTKYRGYGKRFLQANYDGKWGNFLKAINEDTKMKCRHCGKIFQPKVLNHLQWYCSDRCTDDASILRTKGIKRFPKDLKVEEICKNCGTHFIRPAYMRKNCCSDVCSKRYYEKNNRMKNREKILQYHKDRRLKIKQKIKEG